MPGKLPNELIPLPNQDKKWHESWFQTRNLLNFPHPFRAVLCGPPNRGKSTTIKNILMRVHPPFQEVKVIHPDPQGSQEYDDLDAEVMAEIPPPEDWEGQVKTLVIIDDVELKLLNKDQLRNLDRLFGYVSTHKNISCICTAQDAFNIAPCVRRCANLFVLWKSHDLDAMATLARKSGLKLDDFRMLFSLCTQPRDSIWLDLTDESPAPLRINGFKPIEPV